MIAKKDGQILITTLLVLMIMAMSVISVIILLNRDTGQVVSNEKYQQVYNASENVLQRTIEKYGDRDLSLDNLTGGQTGDGIDPDLAEIYSECSVGAGDGVNGAIEYECAPLDSYSIAEEIPYPTTLLIRDNKEIENFEILKDGNYTINLQGYPSTAGVEILWNQSGIALEFMLVYKVGNDFEVVYDVWDKSDQETYLNSLLITNSLTYSQIAGEDANRSILIPNFPVSNLHSLTITPRFIGNSSESVTFNIRPTLFIDFPFQMREFEVVSYDDLDVTTPVVEVYTSISLFPQIDSIFNYSLITDDTIQFEI